MKKTIFLLTLITLLLLAGTALAFAPPPGLQLDWWVMGGGGGQDNGGPLQINATIGQPAIGSSDAGPLTLDWGYWPQRMPKVYQPVILK